MRVLLIKTSSMGDIIHTLPALTDAGRALPDIQLDWVVEEAFQTIPPWHPLVKTVIPIALRHWRKAIFSRETKTAWQLFYKQLRSHQYDVILDAQGLIKSALISFFAKGPRAGLDGHSAREALASLAYSNKYTVNFDQHAVTRMRQLFSQALHYPLPDMAPDFGLNRQSFATNHQENNIVFLHGTTWSSKQWPESYWIELAKMAEQSGYRIKMSGGNVQEVARAHRIAKACRAVEVMPYLSITEMATWLANAKAVVAVDTGFGHLAAALGVPTVSLYGSTNPAFTGALGAQSVHLSAQFPCSPCLNRSCTYHKPSSVKPACYTSILPHQVWEAVQHFSFNINE